MVDLAAVELVLHPFDLKEDGTEAQAIARRLRLRHATDSTYMRLAAQLNTKMWALDGPLARNAADVGLLVKLIAELSPAG